MNLLFVANFPPGVGYAWNTIEEVFRGIAERWQRDGGRVFICYPPSEAAPPGRLVDAGVTPVEFEYRDVKIDRGARRRFTALLRRHRIDVLYLTDKPSWAWYYPSLRAAGVRRLVIHDRTSGERTVRPGLLGALKRIWHGVPGVAADCLIGVSRFVADRMLASGTPPDRTFVVYNGIPLERFYPPRPGALAAAIAAPPDAPIVFASGRAHPYKGIETPIRAAARLEARPDLAAHVAYCGDGPALAQFKTLAADLGLRRFHFLGRRSDVPELLGSATVAAVPSHWAEAFGLAVVEAMASAVPVVASAVGGIPELVDEGVTGYLVPPADPVALADALERLLRDPAAGARIGAAGLEIARKRFSIERTVDELYRLARPAARSLHGA